MKTSKLANGWKAMEVALGDENGKVTVQARSDPGGMNVSVRFSEGRLRAQMAANARELQETMQAQYGSDVDLSFAGGNPDGSEGQASDGSLPERRSAPSSLTESANDGTENGIMHRWHPNGENEWIG
jgi:hypothetical protein